MVNMTKDELFEKFDSISKNYPHLTIQQRIEIFLLFKYAPKVPYRDITTIATNFLRTLKKIVRTPMPREAEEKEYKLLVDTFFMDIEKFSDESLVRGFFLLDKENKKLKKALPAVLAKYNIGYVIEKDGNDNHTYYEYSPSHSDTNLIKLIPSIPGIRPGKKKVENVNQGTSGLSQQATGNTNMPHKTDSPVFSEEDKNKTESAFTDAFKGAAEFSENDIRDSRSVNFRMYLAIPSVKKAEKYDLPMIDKDGNVLEGKNLAETIRDWQDEAKSLGAKFDRETWLYYVPPNTPLDDFRKWFPEEVEKNLYPELTLTEKKNLIWQIKRDLKNEGLDVDNEELLFDAGYQNVQYLGKSGPNKSGSYKISSLGEKVIVVAKNFKHEDSRKVFTYHVESRETALNKKVFGTRKVFNDVISKARAAIEKDGGFVSISKLEEWERNASVAEEIYTRAGPADPNHPYLVKKGLRGHTYTLRSPKIRKNGEGYPELLIPLYDVHSKIWTIQHIEDPNTVKKGGKSGKWTGIKGKWLKKEGRMEKRNTRADGCFYIVSKQLDTPSTLPDTIVIAEGFATAATLNLALNTPVVMAIFKGNIKKVISSFVAEYPDKKFIIASDFDVPKKEIEKGEGPWTNSAMPTLLKIQEGFGKDKISIMEYIPENDEQVIAGFSDFNDGWVAAKEESQEKLAKFESSLRAQYGRLVGKKGAIPASVSNDMEEDIPPVSPP